MSWLKIDERKIDGLTIITMVLPEEEDPSEWFDNDPDIVQNIADGKLEWFQVWVWAEKLGIKLAEDFLGGCCYATHSDFVDDIYHADMVHGVIYEANETIKKLAEI